MATTRLGQFGVGLDAYPGFLPKGDIPTGPHIGLFTRLGAFGIGMTRYAAFVPKAAAATTRDNFFLVM